MDLAFDFNLEFEFDINVADAYRVPIRTRARLPGLRRTLRRRSAVRDPHQLFGLFLRGSSLPHVRPARGCRHRVNHLPRQVQVHHPASDLFWE